MEQINYVENELLKGNDLPSFSAGDTVTVHYKIKEGGKERTQLFKGVVIQRKGKSTTETFTVRKISSGIGVERICLLYTSPSPRDGLLSRMPSSA